MAPHTADDRCERSTESDAFVLGVVPFDVSPRDVGNLSRRQQTTKLIRVLKNQLLDFLAKLFEAIMAFDLRTNPVDDFLIHLSVQVHAEHRSAELAVISHTKRIEIVDVIADDVGARERPVLAVFPRTRPAETRVPILIRFGAQS